ncbi:Uma2 family endonuclease [Nocardiopsis sp. RSe5-2]|uniref:Uma2 family endonuclease n=1 Tax=Nocardiopsis endophytica TaxID=3018445 RepID=A0ABT4U5P2_9ACTN|nr:Uma2 family endonuclease [Nocardiopsis endophytica]MDA2812278.1 Uma2 family endonuclease [Nocardiopsis endophytica]
MAAPLPETPFPDMPFREAPRDLNEVADHLEPPEGYRVEIIDGSLILSPTPVSAHAAVATDLTLAMAPVLPSDSKLLQNVTLMIMPSGERYVPDLVLLPKPLVKKDQWRFPSYEALLSVEITSPGNAETDRVKKTRGYARGEVPAYLLVDMEAERLTLFLEPEGGVYRKQVSDSEGLLRLPEPFTGPIGTSDLFAFGE